MPAFVATLSSFVNSNDADKNRLHIYLGTGNGKKKTGKEGKEKEERMERVDLWLNLTYFLVAS